MKWKPTILIIGPFLAFFYLSGFQSDKDRGFVNLFNGKNFDGWKLMLRNGDTEMAKKVFAIDKGGIIHVFKNLPDSFGTKIGRNATHGMMWSDKKYSRFIFKFEYKWGKKVFNNYDQFQYDAGFYYHVNDRKIWPIGVEYQVRYNDAKNKNHTGDFWASGKETRFNWTADNHGRFALAEYGGSSVPQKEGEHLAAEASFNGLNNKWNNCEIIVMDNKYAIHKLNGKIVNYATDLTLDNGYIGLQSETGEIYYRNIMIKELPSGIPAESFLDF